MALLYHSPTRSLPDGYIFRGGTLRDLPMVARLLSQRQITGSLNTLVEEIRQEWLKPNFNPAMDVRLVFDQRERLIGYIEVWTALLPPLQPWLWGCVHPEYEGRGIGTTLLSWAEARVRLAMELFPRGQRFAPRFGAPRALATAQTLCETLGWRRAHPDPTSRKTTGTLRLLDESAYDVYEKEMRSML